MIYLVNTDAPGFIGKLGTALGEAGINIATFNLGRRAAGGEAVALVSVDGEVAPDVVQTLCRLEGVREVVPLSFCCEGSRQPAPQEKSTLPRADHHRHVERDRAPDGGEGDGVGAVTGSP